MAITLTDKAAQHVQKYLTRRGKGVGLRLGVRTTGCSGLAYKLEYVDELAPEDTVFESSGIKIVIDPKSVPAGMMMFSRAGSRAGLPVEPPVRRRSRREPSPSPLSLSLSLSLPSPLPPATPTGSVGS